MFCGPHFIISTMQAGITPIFKVFGMTNVSLYSESLKRDIHLASAIPDLYTISRQHLFNIYSPETVLNPPRRDMFQRENNRATEREKTTCV